MVSQRKKALESAIPTVQRILQTDTLPQSYDARIEVVPDNSEGSDGSFAVMFTYKDNGQEKTINLNDPSVLFNTTLPQDIKEKIRNGYGQITGVASELKAYDYAIEQANKLDEIAFESAFGVGSYEEFRRQGNKGWVDRYAKEYPNDPQGFLDEIPRLRNTRKYLQNLPDFRANLATIIREYQQERIRNASGASNASSVYRYTDGAETTRNVVVNPIDHLITIGTKALGIPSSELEQYRSTPNVEDLYTRIMQSYDETKAETYLNNFDNYLAYQAFNEKEDSKFTRYLETFENHWKLGISADGLPLHSATGPSEQGMRQNQKNLYSFNVNATPQGKRFKEVMTDLVMTAIGSNQLFDVETNTKITDKDRERFVLTSSGAPKYTIAGFTFDDEGMNAIVTLPGDVQNNLAPKTFEIRGMGPSISREVGTLGLKGGIMLGAIDEMLSGFLTEEKSPSQEYGQRRSNPVSMITAGGVKLPVMKSISNQMIDGQLVKEGTLIYKPLFGGETVYSTDPTKIAEAAFQDAARIEQMTTTDDVVDINTANIPNIKVSSNIVEEGRTTGSNAIRYILNELGTSSNGNQLHVTSLSRFTNPQSAHFTGDAVDIRLVDNGRIDQNAVTTVKDVITRLESNPNLRGLYEVMIEFQSDDENYKALKQQLQGTPVNVIINKKATAPHIHIEFNRVRVAQQITQ